MNKKNLMVFFMILLVLPVTLADNGDDTQDYQENLQNEYSIVCSTCTKKNTVVSSDGKTASFTGSSPELRSDTRIENIELNGATADVKGGYSGTINVGSQSTIEGTNGVFKLSSGSTAEIKNGVVTIKKAVEGSSIQLGGREHLVSGRNIEVDSNNNIIKSNTEVTFNGRTFSSNGLNDIEIIPISGGYKVSGQTVEVKENNNVVGKFKGAVTFHDVGYKTLWEDTTYTVYINGQKSKSYKVTKPTAYYTEKDKCDGTANCIEEYGENLRISAKDNNEIEVRIFDDSIKHLNIDEMNEGNKVVVRKKNAILVFGKDRFDIGGSKKDMELSVTLIYKGKEYQYGYLIFSGDVMLSHLRYFFSNFITLHPSLSGKTFAEFSEIKAAKICNWYGLDYNNLYPKGLGQHKDKAISLEQFLSMMKEYTGANPWNAYNTAVPDPSNEEEIRYVIDPVNNNYVVDMKHFMKAGSASILSDLVGDWVEYRQRFGQNILGEKHFESGGNPQDYYSNAMGSDFFRNHWKPSSKKTLSEQIGEYLMNHKA